MVKYKPKGPVSLSVAVVKILEWVAGDVGSEGGLGETSCDIKDYTPALPILKWINLKATLK